VLFPSVTLKHLELQAPSTLRQINLKTALFTLKTHQMFSILTRPEKVENATVTGHFGLLFEERSVRDVIVFEKLVSKMFSVRNKTQGSVFVTD